MTEKEIEVKELAPGEFDITVSEDLYIKLKEAADSVGAESVGSFVSGSLLPARLAEISRSR